MGKNSIEISAISNQKARAVTYKVRKRGLIRKTIELSMLCDKSIFLGIIDKDSKICTVYQSHSEILKEIVDGIESNKYKTELLTNDYYRDYEDIYYSKLKAKKNHTTKFVHQKRRERKLSTSIKVSSNSTQGNEAKQKQIEPLKTDNKIEDNFISLKEEKDFGSLANYTSSMDPEINYEQGNDCPLMTDPTLKQSLDLMLLIQRTGICTQVDNNDLISNQLNEMKPETLQVFNNLLDLLSKSVPDLNDTEEGFYHNILTQLVTSGTITNNNSQ